MNILHNAVTITGLVMVAPGAYADVGRTVDWKYSAPVRYAENHDPSMVWLQDGRKLQVRYGAISWKEVEQWSAGRILAITYERGTGACLRDPVTGKAIPIIGGLVKHPIDSLCDRYGHEALSTVDMVELRVRAAGEWEAEGHRVYEELRRCLTPAGRTALENAQTSWAAFVKAEKANIGKIYDQDGTIHRVFAADRCLELQKQRTLTLINYWGDAPLDNYDVN